MSDLFSFADQLGPEKILHVHHPAIGLKGIVVVDNTAAGPAIGGIRMAPDVSAEECFRLARAMTLKNASAGLAHGGGKAVLFGDPGMARAEKERLIRAFAQGIARLEDYIPGPDMGTDEICMAWIHAEIGRVVGLPPEVGGIPLDEIGATGYGLCVCAEVAQEYCDLRLDGARVVVQGFGAVGKHAARFLAEKGARLVAASDSRGGLHNPDGIDVEALIEQKAAGKSVADSDLGTAIPRDAVLDVECEIWIPAARPDVLRSDNVDRLRARLVAQGANIPATPEAEQRLAERGILSVPDFIANAGGVICAAVEYQGGSQDAAFEAIRTKIGANTRAVLERARAEGCLPRQAAEALAVERVRTAMSFRRAF